MGILAAILLLGSLVPHQPELRPLRSHPVMHGISYNSKRNPDDCTLISYPTTLNTPSPILNNDGFVIVDFLIDPSGKVVAAMVLQDNGSNADSLEAVQAVGLWRFTPALCTAHAPSYVEGFIIFRQ